LFTQILILTNVRINNLFHHFDVIIRSGFAQVASQEVDQLGHQSGFQFGILPAPGAAFHFKEVSDMRFGDLVNIDKELKSFIPDQEADAVFFDYFFDLRLEVFSIEARTLSGSGHVAAA